MSSVDVIVPCYKYGRYLRECVQSVLTQEGVHVRVLILDDASPDETPTVATELAADPRVVYRRHEDNRGHVETYNEGIHWASSEYLLLLSADDLLTPGALCRAAAVLDRHAEVGLTYGDRLLLRDGDVPPVLPPDNDRRGYSIRGGRTFLLETCWRGENFVPTPTAVVRTVLQQKIGGYRKELPHSGDLEMWLRFASYAAVGVLSSCQAYYRMHGNNMFEAYRGVRDCQEVNAAFDSFFRSHRGLIDATADLEVLAVRAVARNAFWTGSRCFDDGDTAACRQFAAFALEMDPRLRSSRDWLRLRCKLALGARLWSWLRPIVRRGSTNTPELPREALLR